MDAVNVLLQLPFEVIANLAMGYIGYRLAFAGRSKGHQAFDTVCLVLVFAAIGKASTAYSAGTPSAKMLQGCAMVVVSALLWHLWLRSLVRKGLGRLGISESDTLPTLWQSINASPAAEQVVRIVVRLTDGSAVISEGMHRFRGSPFKAWTAGEDGAIAIYVTGVRPSLAADWDDVPLAENGQLDLTYIPASRIADVEFTLQP